MRFPGATDARHIGSSELWVQKTNTEMRRDILLVLFVCLFASLACCVINIMCCLGTEDTHTGTCILGMIGLDETRTTPKRKID